MTPPMQMNGTATGSIPKMNGHQRRPTPSSTSSPKTHPRRLSSSSGHHPSVIEYMSSAPIPPSSSDYPPNGASTSRPGSAIVLNDELDEEAPEEDPTYMYTKLPPHMLDERGRPDYLRMILMSKVYSAPLKLEETPLTLAINLSARFGCQIYLKREDLTPVFSFKIRGAYNMMAHLSEEEKRKGVITCSAGNHAQGVALASSALGIPATVLMPTSTPSIKHRNVSRLGANVVLRGNDFDESKMECIRLSRLQGLTFIPPFDDPYVIAGQGTVGMEICRQVTDIDSLDGIFASVGGGGLVAGIASYVKRVAKPSVGVYGVETVDGDAMSQSLAKGKRVLLDEVGPFADGTAVRIVGEEPFRMCKELLDGIVTVNNDEICAAIKDVFEETRSVPEPSGALSLAGLKAHIVNNKLQGSGKRFIAVVSGGNMNFGRLRFVAERAELGERREVLMSVKVPEKPGSFVKLHDLLNGRAVTEFSYRYSSPRTGHIITSFLLGSSSSSSALSPEDRAEEVGEIIKSLTENGIEAVDLSEDEFAKSHVRHLVGGRSIVSDERIFTFEFPERPNALGIFLQKLSPGLNISLFHYRNHGADVGKVLVGIQVPEEATSRFEKFLEDLGYPYVEETDNVAYRQFLCAET